MSRQRFGAAARPATLEAPLNAPAAPALAEPGEPPLAPPRRLSGRTRAQVKRLHGAVLAFYLVDALLLTAYGAAGTLALHVGWLYGLAGCLLAGVVIGWF